jgi:cytochrome c oxidase subunit III
MPIRNSNQKHLFHMVNPSPWPFLASLATFFFTTGLVFYMHRILFGGLVFLFGLLIILVTAFL